MTDILGYRKKIAVLVPSTNTVVEPETHMMSVPGVTAHTSRIRMHSGDLSNDAAADRFHTNALAEVKDAMDSVLTSQPDYVVMGISAPTFIGGKKGSAETKQRLLDLTRGRGVAIGSEACAQALHAFRVKRISILSPYQPAMDEDVRTFFTDWGFDVVKLKGLRIASAVAIAHVTESEIRESLAEIDSPRVQALVQVGTNLAFVKLADQLERELGKPVIAINAATWWTALRELGIPDKIHGCGALLREH